MNWLPKIALAAVLAWSLAPAANAAERDCETYQSIRHCGIGDANLKLSTDESRLRVSNLGPQGNDGFASIFEPAYFWTAGLNLPSAKIGDELSLVAKAQGFQNAELNFLATAEGLETRIDFTASSDDEETFRLVVRRDNEVVAGLLCNPIICGNDDPDDGPGPGPTDDPGPTDGPGTFSGTILLVEREDLVEQDLLGDVEQLDFGVDPANGGCRYSIQLDHPVEVRIDGRLVAVGDTIELMEVVKEDVPTYPYSEFGSMEFVTSLPRIVLTDERVRYISNGF